MFPAPRAPAKFAGATWCPQATPTEIRGPPVSERSRRWSRFGKMEHQLGPEETAKARTRKPTEIPSGRIKRLNIQGPAIDWSTARSQSLSGFEESPRIDWGFGVWLPLERISLSLLLSGDFSRDVCRVHGRRRHAPNSARRFLRHGTLIGSKYCGIMTLVLGDAAVTSSANSCAAASDWSRNGAYPYPSQCVGMTTSGFPKARISRRV